MAVLTNALTTTANAKAALGIASADTSNDTLIAQYIDRATAQIESMTERKLKARKYNGSSGTFTLGGSDTIASEDYLFFSGSTIDKGGDTVCDPSGYGIYHLPQYPVLANTDLTFALGVLTARAAAGETWSDTTLVEWVDFVVDREKGILRLTGGRFTPGFRNYRITMAAGYKFGAAQPYVPPDLEQVCIAMVKKLFRNESGVTSESLGTWSKSYDVEKADKFIDDTIAKYRRLSV